MPCLNEAETLTTCIHKAKEFLVAHQISGEVIVADNGSTDGSLEIARNLGARIVNVRSKGYGHALMGGIEAALGKFIIIGDADESYDFSALEPFLEKLRAGFDLVQGCRLPAGRGQIMPQAMPFLHRWVGNPLFSLLVRRMFHAPVNDVYCGLRGFTKRMFKQLDLHCTGMEFATEMIIKASVYDIRIAEVPITLHPDGRTLHPPHLKTFRDGWRTLRFFLMCSPRWLFLYPGFVLILLGMAGYGLAMPGFSLLGVTFDAHTLLFASLALLLGYQSILFALFARTFAVNAKLLPPHRFLNSLFRHLKLEHGLLTSAVGLLIGIVLLGASINQWREQNFGPLDYSVTMRYVIPGVTLTALSFQTVLSSFFVSILSLRRR